MFKHIRILPYPFKFSKLNSAQPHIKRILSGIFGVYIKTTTTTAWNLHVKVHTKIGSDGYYNNLCNMRTLKLERKTKRKKIQKTENNETDKYN